jgi:hypothetical protein
MSRCKAGSRAGVSGKVMRNVLQCCPQFCNGCQYAPLCITMQMVDRKLVIAQRVAAICIWSGRHQASDEVRAGIIGEIPAGNLVVGQVLLLKVKAIE